MSITLSKISLTKNGEAGRISLKKNASRDEVIEVNLNWSQPQKSGLLAVFGKRTLDLDLGCLVEHIDGKKTLIQPLGNTFGELDAEPYVKHSGDDRTGASEGGETIRIRVEHWKRFRRVCVYAYIYEGAPDWATAKGVVTVRVPGQPELEVQMGLQKSSARLCAIAMLSNPLGSLAAEIVTANQQIAVAEQALAELTSQRDSLRDAHLKKAGAEPEREGPEASFFAKLLPDFLAPPEVLRARWCEVDVKVAGASEEVTRKRQLALDKQRELERGESAVDVTRLLTFHDGSQTGTWQSDLDQYYGWGMVWSAARK
jgi:uncharacterized protein involved in tellurium resistance